jgi:DNA-binding GntR family transcriptional regulator
VVDLLNERIVQVRVVTSPPRFQRSVDEHIAIVSALRARDAVAAAEAMRRHLANARENLVFLT